MIATSACAAEQTVADPFTRKTLVLSSKSYLSDKSNGTVTGKMRGEVARARYAANETTICSEFSAPAFLKGKTFCSVPVITGDTVVFYRQDGSKSPVYTIQD